MSNSIIQGDQYSIPILIITDNGDTVFEDVISGVRVCIGQFVEEYPNGGLTYDSNGIWKFNLTQEKSYKLKNEMVNFQVQVKYKNGDIISMKPKKIEVIDSIIKRAW